MLSNPTGWFLFGVLELGLLLLVNRLVQGVTGAWSSAELVVVLCVEIVVVTLGNRRIGRALRLG
jgi:hypothetical protein